MSGRPTKAACGAFFRAGVSVIALCGAGSAIAAEGTAAQPQGPATDGSQTQQSSSQTSAKSVPAKKDEIVIVGVRRALETAATIKKNAPTFVDSVTATDIGAFPDQSAAGAIQRIPGVSVNRLQSADDSTHPSGEPTQVLIRGLAESRAR